MTMCMKVFYEHTPGGGEDAGICGRHHAVVFDGLGGTGGITCSDGTGNTCTEAKLASNAAAQAVQETISSGWEAWNAQLDPADSAAAGAVADRIADELTQAINARLWEQTEVWQHDGDVRYMPTTMAGWITFPAPEGRLLAVALWAGDSRCYVMDAHGMRQISRDDADVRPGEDAMTELLRGESPRMTNHICLHRPYVLNRRCMLIDETSLLFACTDGLYNGVPTPMHLEYYLRLCINSGENLQEAAGALHAFIGDELLVCDDSATLCAVAHVPMAEEQEKLEELRTAFAARTEELEESYISPCPAMPVNPEGDTETLLRKLAADLARTKVFRQGLHDHVVQLILKDERPVVPGLQYRGQAAIDAIRRRVQTERRHCMEEQLRLEEQIARAEDELRGCIAALRIRRRADVSTGPFTSYWEKSDAPIAQKVDDIFNMLAALRHNLFEREGYMYTCYKGPAARDVALADPYLHDLIRLLNADPAVGRLHLVEVCEDAEAFTEEPLDGVAQEAIFGALVSGSPLTREMAPELRLGLDEMDALMRHAHAVRELRARLDEVMDAAQQFVPVLTDEECIAVDEYCAVPFARQFVGSWYQQHCLPEHIALSENMVQQCEERLRECWQVDAAQAAYTEQHQSCTQQQLALWERYKPGYTGWITENAAPVEETPDDESGEEAGEAASGEAAEAEIPDAPQASVAAQSARDDEEEEPPAGIVGTVFIRLHNAVNPWTGWQFPWSTDEREPPELPDDNPF